MKQKIARFLALDLGDRRTGLALGDSVTNIVTPIGTINVAKGPALLAALKKVIEENAPDEIVIGLPLNMDDSEGAASKAVREFALQIAQLTNKPIHLHDERLTTFEADSRMSQSGRTHAEKKALRDSLAAAAILEDFLRAHTQPDLQTGESPSDS
ncbi:MAG: Holliday junction resolvase RuvX [Phycisphaerales bacterium]|nr:Holliday junction resolvase RuvX [Phycisphaerales bacterium]